MDKIKPCRIRIYTTRWCGFCRAAIKLLEQEGLNYEEVDLTNDPAARDEARRSSGWPTVPIVFVDGLLVGGYTELRAKLNAGGLEEAAGNRPGLRA